MSKLRTVTRDEGRLDAIHPGEILREDFPIGSGIPVDEVSRGAGIARERLEAPLSGAAPADADMDPRLGRYLGTPEGFFLRRQIDFDLEEVRRSVGQDLDRIVPRAA